MADVFSMKVNYRIPVIAPESLVGVANCVGAYRVIRRVRKNVYEIQFKANVLTIPRSQLIFPLAPGEYLLNGGNTKISVG